MELLGQKRIMNCKTFPYTRKHKIILHNLTGSHDWKGLKNVHHSSFLMQIEYYKIIVIKCLKNWFTNSTEEDLKRGEWIYVRKEREERKIKRENKKPIQQTIK